MSEIVEVSPNSILYRQFEPKDGLENLVKMIETELSEPYSIFLYRHFVNDFPKLSVIALHEQKIIGCIIGKIEEEKDGSKGYIAMIVVLKEYRKNGIAKKLVEEFNERVAACGVFEVVLETECCNKGALRLYEGKKSKKLNDFSLWIYERKDAKKLLLERE